MENKKIRRAKELFYQNKLQKSKQLFTDLYKKNYDEPLINFFLRRIFNKSNQNISALFHFFLALKKNRLAILV